MEIWNIIRKINENAVKKERLTIQQGFVCTSNILFKQLFCALHETDIDQMYDNILFYILLLGMNTKSLIIYIHVIV